ncbi:MAG: tetratricopeptide repeat protein [Saprospiraceae bacterium]|nr:tetratricopeptide repeat protein [Saprospiraceae bacterium]
MTDELLLSTDRLRRFLLREGARGYAFAVADNERTRQEIIRQIKRDAEVAGKNMSVLHLNTQSDVPILKQLSDAVAGVDALCVLNLDHLLRQPHDVAEKFIRALNFSRETINNLDIPIVWWINSANLPKISNWAIDLYSQRATSDFHFAFDPPNGLEVPPEFLPGLLPDTQPETVDAEELEQRIQQLEEQLASARARNRPDRRIARELVIPLAAAYLEAHQNGKALALIQQYEAALETTLPGELIQLGDLCRELGNLTEAQKHFEEALAYSIKRNDRYEEAISYSKLGSIYQAQGKFEEALRFFEKETDLFEELYEANPRSESLKNGLAISYSKLGDIYQAQGKFEEALRFFEKDLALTEELCEANPRSVELLFGLGVSMYKMWSVLSALKRAELGRSYLLNARALFADLTERTQLSRHSGMLAHIDAVLSTESAE